MSRFCSKHINEREDQDVLIYYEACRQRVAVDPDPRTTSGKRALREKMRVGTELRRRGIDPDQPIKGSPCNSPDPKSTTSLEQHSTPSVEPIT